MMARAIVIAGAAVLAAACAVTQPAVAPAAPAASPHGVALMNPAFKEAARAGERCAAGWTCSMHDDPRSFRFFHEQGEGAQGYCIESVGREPWARVSQAIEAGKVAPLRGRHVRLSLSLKLDGMALGEAGPLIVALGGSGQVLRKGDRLVGPKAGWQRVEVEMEVPPDTLLLEVGVLLQGKPGFATGGGMGRICVGDARLEVVAPAGAV